MRDDTAEKEALKEFLQNPDDLDSWKELSAQVNLNSGFGLMADLKALHRFALIAERLHFDTLSEILNDIEAFKERCDNDSDVAFVLSLLPYPSVSKGVLALLDYVSDKDKIACLEGDHVDDEIVKSRLMRCWVASPTDSHNSVWSFMIHLIPINDADRLDYFLRLRKAELPEIANFIRQFVKTRCKVYSFCVVHLN
jgi:hypothetical protein